MPTIIPSTDLRNRFSEVEELARTSREPIYLTKNGRGSLVLMDIDAFEEYQNARAYRCYVDEALARACEDKANDRSRYTAMEAGFVSLLDEPLADPRSGEGRLSASA